MKYKQVRVLYFKSCIKLEKHYNIFKYSKVNVVILQNKHTPFAQTQERSCVVIQHPLFSTRKSIYRSLCDA